MSRCWVKLEREVPSAGLVVNTCELDSLSQDLRIAARRAVLLRALQPPDPPHRYPAAHHRALLIYCYTGFHN